MVAFLIYFIITVATTPVGTSHLSHVGGFVTGLFPAMMFLPHLQSQKYATWHPCLICNNDTNNNLCGWQMQHGTD